MRMNRHEGWKEFVADHLLPIEVGLPETVTHSEHRFRLLLEAGQVVISGSQFSLEELTPVQWSGLYRFAQVFFREFESYSPETLFPAFRREVCRRGDRFPR